MPRAADHARASTVAFPATICLLCLMLMGVGAHATTYTMVYDGDLHDQAGVVARVEVLATSPAPGFGAPHTDHMVLVERLLKGRVSGTTIVVRVLGGVGPDGLGLEVHGVPVLTAGDRALLFLQPRGDGTYGILHWMLGAFFEAEIDDQRIARRRFDAVREIGSDSSEPERLRDWDRFESWLADRSLGTEREPDYLTSVAREPDVPAQEQPRPGVVRFFEFDQGDEVTWKVGRGVSKARKSFRAAIRAWNGVSSTEVLLKQRGRSRSTSGLRAPDGVNSVVFGDPNAEIEGSYRCDSGGVIAVGGVWFFSNPALERRIPGAKGKGKASPALEADILVNDGAECLVSGDVTAAARVFGHELGHTLGLRHSCDDAEAGSCDTASKADALMRAFFQDGAVGAQLGSWDVEALTKLYRPARERRR